MYFIIIEKRIYSAANNSRLFTNLWNLQNMLALSLPEFHYSNFVKRRTKETKTVLCSNDLSGEVKPPLSNYKGLLMLTSTTWKHYILAGCSGCSTRAFRPPLHQSPSSPNCRLPEAISKAKPGPPTSPTSLTTSHRELNLRLHFQHLCFLGSLNE